MEGGGATAGPFAGACVHPMGERAVVERPGGGAQKHVPHAVATASSCSSSPARRRVKPAQRRSALRLGRSASVYSIWGEMDLWFGF
jgi:hypothetical protein